MRWFGGTKIWIRAGLLGLVVTGGILSGLLERLELQAFNGQFHLRGPRPPRTPIVIVSIDEDSFDELDLAWPWPRQLHGALLEILSQGKPAAIGLDILFAEPSARGPADDQALGQAVGQAGNVVLAAALTEVKEAFYTKADLNPPLKLIRDHAAGFGFVNFDFDQDAFVRSAALTRSHQGVEIPSFDLLLYRLGVKAGIPAAPLPKQPRVLINYRGGPRTFPTVPFYRIITGEVSPEEFQGKIVLVGATSPILHDIFPTPFAPQGIMPGVEIHANMLETLFQGIALTRVPLWGVGLVALLAGLFSIWLTNRARPLVAFGVLTGIGLAYSGAAFAVFVWGQLWVDHVPVQLALTLGYGATVVENFIQEQREKRRLSRFFSPDVVREVVRHRDELALGSSRRLVTVLFSDIRGFTSIAEKLSPEEVAELLREYLTKMTDAVFRHGGTVDKYIGDAVMALYNAPFDQSDHAVQAVRTALEFQDIVKALSDHWEATCGTRLRNGVGINTGDAVVGTLGSVQRLEYTAVGDAVNVASRLEGLTKDFATPVIVSESTHEAIKHLFFARYLGEVTVKGRELPVKIFGVERETPRRAPRVSLEAPLTITDAGVSVPASISDLSATGLAAKNIPRLLSKGQVVQLRLELPELPRAISMEGRVMWGEEDRAGIMFLEISADDRKLLEDFLERRAGGS
jgi:adenylate cyclase